MPKAQSYTAEGKKAKQISLPSIFETKINEHVLYEAVKCYLANQRQGTAKTKTRSEVNGGGEKPYRQKGTGHARAGSNTSPIWVRGSKAHGPKPRLYRTSLNRKARRKAVLMALSAKANDGAVKVLEAIGIQEPKTKQMWAILANMEASSDTSLLLVEANNRNAMLASRNLKGLTVKPVNEANVYDVLHSKQLIVTEKSLARLQEVFSS